MKTEIYNLDDCKTSDKNGLYGGAAGSKDGIIFQGEQWMVKYPKSTVGMERVDISYTTSPICEYLGSHVYQILGYDTHETILGIRHNKLVVACKDFTDKTSVLAEIRTIKNHANDILSEKFGIDIDSTGDAHNVNLEALILHIRHNPILSKIPDVEKHFFEQAVIDIYINNSDRNNGNWGILRHLNGDPDSLAPIFDNGGSFQDKLSDIKASRILQDKATAIKNAYGTQTVYADSKGKLYSSVRFIALSNEYPKLKDAIIKLTPLIRSHQSEIESLIDEIPAAVKDEAGKIYEVCGSHIKELYKLQLNSRMEHILEAEYQKLTEKQLYTEQDSKYVCHDDDWER